jgi:peptidoglycan-associated lipoprotein
LQENAQALVAALSDQNIVIEGHCDERGTESYNMVLGKRRGNAVKEFLVDLGVSGDKLQVMSYGKEKPFCTDQNEQCWQENRRGHFIVQ